MSRILRTRRWLSALAGHGRQLPPPGPPDNRAGDSLSADTCSAADWLPFRRIVDIPFDACMAALEHWQLTGYDGELHLGNSLLRGPVEHDHHFGTFRIDVRLARGPLRPPARMELDIDQWSSSSTALELIACQRVRPSAAYFRAGHRLLDSLTNTLPAHVPVRQRLGCRTESQRTSPADAFKSRDHTARQLWSRFCLDLPILRERAASRGSAK